MVTMDSCFFINFHFQQRHNVVMSTRNWNHWRKLLCVVILFWFPSIFTDFGVRQLSLPLPKLRNVFISVKCLVDGDDDDNDAEHQLTVLPIQCCLASLTLISSACDARKSSWKWTFLSFFFKQLKCHRLPKRVSEWVREKHIRTETTKKIRPQNVIIAFVYDQSIC